MANQTRAKQGTGDSRPMHEQSIPVVKEHVRQSRAQELEAQQDAEADAVKEAPVNAQAALMIAIELLARSPHASDILKSIENNKSTAPTIVAAKRLVARAVKKGQDSS